MAIVQILAIADVLIIGPQLIDTTLWLVLFVPLVVIAVVWVGQAVNAYRRALALGGAPGGELQLALFLPLVLAVFTGFWLLGGRHGSAASTVEAYMEAWQASRPDVADALFVSAPQGDGNTPELWQALNAWLVSAIAHDRATYGEGSGMDPDRPFSSLRVTQTSATTFSVELVRSERFETTLLGIIPTAGFRTVMDAPVMVITVVQQRTASSPLPTNVWRIDSVSPVSAV